MKHKFLFVLLLLVFAPAGFAQAYMAIPFEADIERFPFFPKPLTLQQMDAMELRPVVLGRAMTVQNWDGKRFRLETLTADTVVLVDVDGFVRYKADCGNRLIQFDPRQPQFRPLMPIALYNGPPSEDSPLIDPHLREEERRQDRRPPIIAGQPVVPPPPVGTWASMTNGLRNASSTVWGGIGTAAAPFGHLLTLLLGVLVIAAVIGGLGYLFVRILR